MELQHKKTYSTVDFREAIVRQICKLPDYDVSPVYSSAKHSVNTHDFRTGTESTITRNCFVCYKYDRAERHVTTYCKAPQCNNRHLHISSPEYNCFDA